MCVLLMCDVCGPILGSCISPVHSDPPPPTPPKYTLVYLQAYLRLAVQGEITPCKIYSKSTCQPGAIDIRKQTANALGCREGWAILEL